VEADVQLGGVLERAPERGCSVVMPPHAAESKYGPAQRVVVALVLCHVALTLRWVALPVAAWAAFGSLKMALGMVGWHLGWALCALVADATFVLFVIRPELVPQGLPPATLKACVVFPPALLVLLSLCTPMFATEVACVLVLLSAALAVCAIKCGRADAAPQRLYVAWGLLDGVLNIVAFSIFDVMCSTSASDDLDVPEPEWSWAVSLVRTCNYLSYLSLLAEILVARELWRAGTPADIALLPVGGGDPPAEPSHPPSLDEADEKEPPLQSLLDQTAVRIGLGWMTLLLLSTLSFFAMQLFGPGEDATTIDRTCINACFCDPIDGMPPDEFENGGEGTHPRNTGGVTVTRDIQYGLAPHHQATHPDGRSCRETRNTDPCHLGKGGDAVLPSDQVPLLLDMYRPSMWRDDEPGAAHPVMILIHGGSFVGGNRTSRLCVNEAYYYARRGFIAVSLEYRLDALSFFPEIGAIRDGVDDAKAAIRFLNKNAQRFGIDSNRIAVMVSPTQSPSTYAPFLVPNGLRAA
jgi:hypothetical protein